MNGVIKVNSKVKQEQEITNIPNYSYEHTINNLRKTIENRNNREHSYAAKHRIILLGDSHVRGYASSLKSVLNSEYDILGVIRPGSGSSELKESAKEEIGQFSYNDLIINSSGTHDLELNGFMVTFQNIRNYIMGNNHSNILLMNIPFRYDLPNSHEVNKKISVLNNKLEKLVRVLPHARFIGSENDQKHFTKHGLHHNKLGKMLVSLQLAEYIRTTFAHKFSTSIPLRWFDSDMVFNLHCDSSRTKTQNRNSSQNRKTPITRSKDFLRLT